MSVEYIEKFYNFYAKVYDHVFGKFTDCGHEAAPELLKLTAGTRLLEVGVGTGNSLARMPWDIEFTGIDLSEKMLNKARKKASSGKMKHVQLLRMDALNLEFEDNCFDCVLAAYFISTVPDPLRALQEMKRVCKPGGYILILNHFQSENPILGFFEKITSPFWYRLGFYSDLNLKRLMAKAGLKIDALVPLEWNGFWKAVRCVNPEE